MKILCVIDSLRSGGKERQFVELINGLVKTPNVDIEVALLSGQIQYQSILDIDVKIHYIPRRHRYDLTPIFKLYRICKDFKPNIMHSWESLCSLFLIPTAQICRIKLVSGIIRSAPEHIGIKSRIRNLVIFVFSNLVLANSNAGLNAYGAPKKKSICIYNGFDQSRLAQITEPSTIKNKHNIHSKYIVGMVGRFAPRKDYETFICSAMKVLEQRNDVEFLAVGDGETLNYCKQLVKSQFRSKIKFLGNQEDVESIVNVFTIGVLTTNQKLHGEGISNSIIEYMALGKPVIATKGGGTLEILRDNVTGFLVDPYDVQSVADKINLILENNILCEGVGAAAKDFVLKEFSLNTFVLRHLECYRKVIAC